MDNEAPTRQRRLIWITIALAAVAIITAILANLWRRRAKTLPREWEPVPPAIPPSIRGLTEAEAEARRLEGQDNTVHFKPPRSRGEIWRENVYTIFNFSLVGLAVVQLLLGQLLGALSSLGVMCLNIGLNIGQEMWARRRLRDVEQATRLKATVIREGNVRSIDPSEIVLGDMLVVGPGDQLLVDGELQAEGQIVVDESMLTGKSTRPTKRAGDQVFAGSFCISGRAVYEAQKVGEERWVVTKLRASQAAKTELTPLERIIDRVLRGLLIIVAIFTILLLFRYFRVDTGIPVDAFADAASVIFNIAPSSLFFMIILAYAAGTADLARLGALVHRARSVESLAHATVVCFAQAGFLTGTHVEVETIDPPEDREPLARSRIHQILGDYARSTSADNLATRTMLATFEGNRRIVHEEAPFLSAYGWSAVAFDDDDLRGVYFLGDPQALEAHLIPDSGEAAGEEDDEEQPAPWRNVTAPLGRFFKRLRPASSRQETDEEQQQSEPEPQAEPRQAQEPDAPTAPAEDEPGPNLFRRLVNRANRVLRREETAPAEEEAPEEPAVQEVVLLFAYLPDLVPLHADDSLPQLPDGLIPLCHLRYSEQVRPEAIDTVKSFSRTGVGIKIFTAHAPDRTIAILRQAELGVYDETPLSAISGSELTELEPEEFGRAAAENTVFGHIAPEQAGQVVRALRSQGQTVAVVGDGVNDVPPMRQANLAVARQSSSQSALSVADIILLEDSPTALQRVLDKGQRIVNGLLDVLKLYLAQVFYLALLILALAVTATGFPYRSAQGSVISVLTLSLPSIGLSLWAAAGVLPRSNLGRLLARFVGPAAVTMSVTATIVYRLFLESTGDMAYAQLTLTYTLVLSGLLLVIFLRPPWRPRVGDQVSSGDWRPAALVIVALIAFFLATTIPLAQRLLYLDWLRQPTDYLVVGLAVLAWALLLHFVWRLMPLEPTVP